MGPFLLVQRKPTARGLYPSVGFGLPRWSVFIIVQFQFLLRWDPLISVESELIQRWSRYYCTIRVPTALGPALIVQSTRLRCGIVLRCSSSVSHRVDTFICFCISVVYIFVVHFGVFYQLFKGLWRWSLCCCWVQDPAVQGSLLMVRYGMVGCVVVWYDMARCAIIRHSVHGMFIWTVKYT